MFVTLSLFDIGKNKSVFTREIGDFVYDEEFFNMLDFYAGTPMLHGSKKFVFKEKFMSDKLGDEHLMIMFTSEEQEEPLAPNEFDERESLPTHLENDPLDYT